MSAGVVFSDIDETWTLHGFENVPFSTFILNIPDAVQLELYEILDLTRKYEAQWWSWIEGA
jgi:hypothetical protein